MVTQASSAQSQTDRNSCQKDYGVNEYDDIVARKHNIVERGHNEIDSKGKEKQKYTQDVGERRVMNSRAHGPVDNPPESLNKKAMAAKPAKYAIEREPEFDDEAYAIIGGRKQGTETIAVYEDIVVKETTSRRFEV